MLKPFLKLTFIAIGAFLVLTHFTGFERDVRALSAGYIGGVKALQGR